VPHDTLEAVGVDLLALDIERVATRTSNNRLRRRQSPELLAEMRDLALQCVRRVPRLVVTPQHVGERARTDGLAGA
jgi:hypothetical protein